MSKTRWSTNNEASTKNKVLMKSDSCADASGSIDKRAAPKPKCELQVNVQRLNE